MKKAKRYDGGGRTFSAEQEAWLGGADRTDPYILARMERAVPTKAPVVDSVKPKTRAEVEAENSASEASKSEAPKRDLSEIRAEDGSLSKLKRNTETGEMYSPDEPITRSFAKSSGATRPAAKKTREPRDYDFDVPETKKLSPKEEEYEKAKKEASTPEAVEKRRKQAESQAIDNMGADFLPFGGIRSIAGLAKNLANRRALNTIDAPKQIANNPTRQLTGPSKADLMARDRAARSAERQTEMLRENARRSGLDPDNMNAEVANAVRQKMGGKDFSLGMKRGGAVKKMAGGGLAKSSSASKRGDGIASKGKTRGKIY